MSTQNDSVKPRITTLSLLKMKQSGEKFASLTAYDATFAGIMDDAGVEVILVGDSLGMVIQGKETTVPVTMDDMAYHTRLVARACRRALVMADMPFMSFATPEEALRNAARLMQEGGHMVKLEGNSHQAETVHRLTAQGIPVCAHIGLRPQSIHKMGGYIVQGRGIDAARAMIEDARVLEEAGADILLLECVPSELAGEITASARTPVIGIGAGNQCDGQILVLYDMLGITRGRTPKFVKNFLPEGESVAGAIEAFARAVKSVEFPGPEHEFQ
uniref:3-methyl-2-oxobutanoate hydroxymethyltransferase n=1 Tax=Candidatus Kentrum sp. SD TaxID=2126332 RepID=A0A450Y7U6_9GAMM|nr:MAG: ketopantoate hydroxymethyltransferase [Candidatus Kentron sp. SD]VFK44703.1 MAG: ketopantoate hydroxymethyltransferase [Candidatus Kentron sp. SD]VFK48949.1 MAG: ketopantoate hydroxymethyltransferase [Candidatus Kentron sp. SD]VFK79604.1 MAG: ketopantoate hydroxymethyltransferase [Candidatus Kentron sp. SD]